ncbi:MAG TPA: D-alanine--D-alanine ligase family protein [Acidimicrobiales bacterium]|jgi:D-alanine-D-alanine ligase|nr:D-alanine--D-alanine ligase family protein [Acidimicrobiales bacterium]
MASPAAPVRLVVLYGGRSAEHDVSCISAFNVVGALDRSRYDLQMIGITTDGAWVDTTAPALAAAGAAATKALPSPDDVLRDRPASAASLEAVTAEPSVVVLPLVHGPMGEDGTLQGLLELAGLPYCGPGVAGSATAMDKGLAKALLTAAGLPQARYLYRSETQFSATLPGEVESELGWPVFVKPANMGSSIGITKVKDPGGLDAALVQAVRYDTAVVIEEAVSDARELEMGVLGWPDLRTSVPGEIKPSHDFYDFEDKYLEGTAALEIPAVLPAGVAEEMSRLAIAACQALRVDSMARADFFYSESRGLLINEVNTIPGFTPISMYPMMWAATGIPYADLIDRLVDQAVRRADRRRRFETGH